MKKIVFTFLGGVVIMGGLAFETGAQEESRRAAVAGSFYERNPKLLREAVLRYLADGKPQGEPVRLLICPHAGFVFSGPVAGKGYGALDGKVKRVIILGPSHYEDFKGIAVPRFRYYETPLGTVPVDRAVVEKLRNEPGVIVADGFDGPEHCLEVQLPFLQVRLSGFSVVPILTGRIDPKKAADLLLPFFDETTAVVASSDLSHYEKQAAARAIDDTTIKTILSGNTEGPVDACGNVPIRIVMHLARTLKLRPVKLDARTSFETAPQHCDDKRVVGYAAIGYVSGALAGRSTEVAEREIGDPVRRFLLDLARKSLEASVRGDRFILPDAIPPEVKERSGCFVTLTVRGALRGCIGYIEPVKPLYMAVAENAANAALSDPRFPKVRPEELRDIRIEVSVLTRPSTLAHGGPDDLLSKLVPGRDGVILRQGARQSTYLPQVWEQLPDKVEFLEQLSLKGGMPMDGWKDAEVKTYRAIHFQE